MSGYANLAYHENVERCVKRLSNFECHRYAPARKTKDHDIVAVAIRRKLGCEHPACIQAAVKEFFVLADHNQLLELRGLTGFRHAFEHIPDMAVALGVEREIAEGNDAHHAVVTIEDE